MIKKYILGPQVIIFLKTKTKTKTKKNKINLMNLKVNATKNHFQVHNLKGISNMAYQQPYQGHAYPEFQLEIRMLLLKVQFAIEND